MKPSRRNLPYGWPKPRTRKKDGSIIPGDQKGRCWICGERKQTEVHHCIHGTAGRQAADIYGLTINICPSCHSRLHDRGTEDRNIEKIAQRAFEKLYGHDAWMRVFGKSYME